MYVPKANLISLYFHLNKLKSKGWIIIDWITANNKRRHRETVVQSLLYSLNVRRTYQIMSNQTTFGHHRMGNCKKSNIRVPLFAPLPVGRLSPKIYVFMEYEDYNSHKFGHRFVLTNTGILKAINGTEYSK